jgi:hypothetical protein
MRSHVQNDNKTTLAFTFIYLPLKKLSMLILSIIYNYVLYMNCLPQGHVFWQLIVSWLAFRKCLDLLQSMDYSLLYSQSDGIPWRWWKVGGRSLDGGSGHWGHALHGCILPRLYFLILLDGHHKMMFFSPPHLLWSSISL